MFSGSTATPSSNSARLPSANSVEGFEAANVAARINRLEKTLLQDLSVEDMFFFLSSRIPALRIFESVWNFSGADIVSIDPKLFVRALQLEFVSFPFSAGVEVYKLVQQKIITDVSMSEGQPKNLGSEVVQLWSDNPVPSFQQALGSIPEMSSQPSVPANFANQASFVPDVAMLSRMFPSFPNSFQGYANVPNFSNQFQNIPSVPNLSSQFQNFPNVPNLPNQFQNFPNVPNLSNQVQSVSNVSNQSASTLNSFAGAQTESPIVPTNLHQFWANQVQNENVAVRPPPGQFMFNGFDRVSEVKSAKFVIGGPRTPFQHSSMGNMMTPNVQSQLFQQTPMSSTNFANQFSGPMAASAAQLPQFQGQTAASAAQMPGQTAASAAPLPHFQGQTAASAAQMPGQTAASAAPLPQFFGQTAASAAQLPRHSATPFLSPAPTDASASLLSSLMLNPAVSQLINTVHSQARSNRPVLPWEALAMVQESFIQDPAMPKGFKRLSVTKVIEAAKQKRAQLPVHIDISRAVKYPEMASFSKSEFLRTRKEYVAAVKASTISGMFNSFKSCFSVTAQNAAKMVFRLSEEHWIEIDDEVMLKWCALYFGPANKKEAIKSLKSIKIFHSDAEHEQSDFVAKFDQVCYDFELAVNDIVDSQDKWPFDPNDIECSGMTLKDIMKEWKELFPKQEGARVFSTQLKKCRVFIEQNLETAFNEQIIKLRKYFDAKDQEVAAGDGKYSTQPSVSTFKDKSKYDKPKFEKQRFVSVSSAEANQAGKRGRDSDAYRSTPKGKVSKAVVAGKDRGKACGSLNNHIGLGCSKDTCPAFGTEWDKSRDKSHVWKSSDMEKTVRMPNDVYEKRLKENPKIIENWKKARHDQRDAKDRRQSVKVSALSALDDDEAGNFDQDQLDVMYEEEEDEHISESHSDSDEVNSDFYSFQVCASRAGAASTTDPFDELGHEDQFFGVTRFANNDEFVFRSLMDPGATINVIAPEVANRAAIQRKQLAVNIFQGKRKQGSVEEMVQCAFELLKSDGSYSRHVEWFAVCDLGYEVLLGRRFCRVQKFTSFDEKLKKFDEMPPRSLSLDIAALGVSHQRMMLRFDRVVAPDGQARNKRKAKAVVGIANATCTSIGKQLLHAENALSSLLVLDTKVEGDASSVLLSFTIDTYDGARSAKRQCWFQVVEGVKLTLSVEFIAEVMANERKALIIGRVVESSKPSDQIQISSDAQEQSDGLSMSSKLRRPVCGDHRKTLFGAAKDLSANDGEKLTASEVEERKQTISKLSKVVKRENEVRFASYHPVKGYRLQRDVERPPVLGWKDHKNHVASEQFWGEQAQVKASMESAQIEYACRQKRRKYNSLRKVLEEREGYSHGVSPDIDTWLQQLYEESHEVVSAMSVDSESWESEFEPGTYVEIVNAVLKPEFNGQRVRLFSKTVEPKFWIVRVLGKNEGKRRCSESMFKKLSELEQKRSVPSGASAGFDDVGIDDAGQPNIETKLLAHRQFGEEYSEELTKRINELKARYPKVFTTDVTEPCLFEPMEIRLIPNAVLPSKARFYRNTPKMREEVKRQIQEQLDWGAIKKCVTPCVSDVLLVKRPHMPGKFRFVVSYIKLNEATVKEQLIMPDPKSQHERLAGNKIFGAIDFSSYYRQIRLHENSQYLTGFASDEGTFCYTRVPMGITGACQYAQKVLQDALLADPVLGPLGIRNYFDDLPFGAKTEDEYMTILEALLEFCVKWKLKVNPDKTVLGVKSITHVGFIVSKDGVAIDPERTRDILELTAPKSVKKVQSVLGVFNYVRNFIPDFSAKAKFLTDKLNAVVKAPQSKALKGVSKQSVVKADAISVQQTQFVRKKEKVVSKFEWSEDDQRQFEMLKTCVLEAPLLSQLDYALPIYIRCDASRFGAGAVLFQYDARGYEHPVCYASRKFLPAERNWATFSQEASTVVWALERFAEYTQGYHTIVECDHRNISFVKKSAMPQLARWRLRLQDMDFTVRYLSGPRNLTADGLSRQHVDDIEVTMSDVIPEGALPKDGEMLSEQIAALYSVEVAANYGKKSSRKRAAEPEPSRGSAAAELVATDAGMIEFAAEAESDSDSDSEGSVDSEEDADVDLTQMSPSGALLHRFGENGELLDANGQAIVREEPQPAHLVVPLLDADDEIRAVHNDLSGHAGTYVTLQRALRNHRSWGTRKQMIEDIDNFILKCSCCQKMRKRRSRSLVDRHVISGSPFSELSIDLLKLPNPDAFGMAYVVVVVDNFSHWTSLVPVKNKSAFEAARALVKVTGDFGVPLRLRSDGGAEFVNGIITGLTRMMGVTHHVVVPYTPTANGIVERANRAVIQRLREMIFSKRLVKHPEHVWSDLLPLVQRAINASVHSATGTSPARILFGNNLDLDRCLLTQMPNARDLDVDRYVDALTYNQRIILEEADKHQSDLCEKVIAANHKAQQRKNKRGEFVEAVPKKIEVGDWVLVEPGPSYPLNKLAPRWLGPFRVLECKDGSELVHVEDTLKGKVRKFLRRQLEVFDVRMMANVEGLKVLAETDGFEFPVEAIIGHALVEEGGVGVAPTQLSLSFKRGQKTKKSFQFLVKWSGYVEPTWVEYKVASRLVQFPGYVAMFPNLRMD
jgi:hypothetical protein